MRSLAALLIAGFASMACLGLAMADTDGTAPTHPAPAADDPASSGEPVLGPIDRYRVIVERPLFTMSRRPSVSETAQLAESTHFVLTLTGIIVESGERQAVFRHREQRRPLRLSVGMSRQGWELLRIADDHVVFRRGIRSTRLALDYSRPSALAGPTVPAGEAEETQ